MPNLQSKYRLEISSKTMDDHTTCSQVILG